MRFDLTGKISKSMKNLKMRKSGIQMLTQMHELCSGLSKVLEINCDFGLLFLTLKNVPNLVLEPAPKTADILQSSFPDLEVRWNNLSPDLFSNEEDFDYHLPIGSMFGFEIQKHVGKLKDKNFSLDWNYLKPDKLRKMYWEQKLKSLSDKPKIGFCWRSKNTSGHRKKSIYRAMPMEKSSAKSRF